jgi:DNA-binding response OmpR family regulator
MLTCDRVMGRRILVAEDDPEIANLVRLHLGDAGYEVRVASSGTEALTLGLASAWDLVVLDLMLPGMDGLDVCRQLRVAGHPPPILMLTARSSEVDRVLGLELGADDYLTKPFSVRELVARVKAIFRRIDAARASGEAASEPLLSAGDLTISVERREVIRAGRALSLTAREFDLLSHFARHPGRVYTRAELLDQVWGYGHEGYEHTVNSHINRLRAKIEVEPANPAYILTVWGVGYKFRGPQE